MDINWQVPVVAMNIFTTPKSKVEKHLQKMEAERWKSLNAITMEYKRREIIFRLIRIT
jgi:hypothetical protein